jgi:uncharacterized membrane protein/mono/diheme cytochrome c family protein
MRSLVVLLALAVLAAGEPSATAALPAPTALPVMVAVGPNPSAVRFFTERVQPVLSANCIGCHGPDKQKSGLRLDSLAAMLRGGDQAPGVPTLVPGDPDGSLLIRSIRWHDDPRMPPKEQLPAAAIADLTRWVELGAPWPTGIAAPPAPPAPAPPPLVGRLHPVVVHLPIGCLLAAVLAELLVLWRGPQWRRTVVLLCAVGAAGAVTAVATGLTLGDSTGPDPDILKNHMLLGWATLVLAVASTALAVAAIHRPALVWPLRMQLAFTVAAVALTGHLGGIMTHGRAWLPF